MKVCIIAEGSYPITRGGLSEWAHLLIKTSKYIDFDVLCIGPDEKNESLYEKLPNVNRIIIQPLLSKDGKRNGNNKGYTLPKKASIELADTLQNVLSGSPLDCERIVSFLKRYPLDKAWLSSKEYWDSLLGFYQDNYVDLPFTSYFWSTYGIYSILFDSIKHVERIPKSEVYHSLNIGIGGFVGSLAKILYQSPLVVTEQGLYLTERHLELSRSDISECQKQQLMRLCESMTKTSYAYADRIVPPCHGHVDIETQLGADPEKIKVVNNGIECDRFQPGPERNDTKLVIGCFARVVPVKGIDILIKAAKSVLEKHQVSFVVVGEIQDEPYYHQCLDLVRELQIGDDFKFIGFANPVEWYHKIDIFVLSSLSEGVPYALLEAMSCMLPCVCTGVGGVPEILSEPGTGFVVPPGDPDSLSEKICVLIENKELRTEIGQRATQIANQKYNITEMADEFLRLYLERLIVWE